MLGIQQQQQFSPSGTTPAAQTTTTTLAFGSPNCNNPFSNVHCQSPAPPPCLPQQQNPFDASVDFHNKFLVLVNNSNNNNIFQQRAAGGSFQPVFESPEYFQASIYNFISCRQDFAKHGKPVGVQVMFHYTNQKAMRSIRSSGLQGIGKRSFFGKGLYCANNPHAFKSYGNIGLIVLVLKGNRKWCLYNEEHKATDETDSFAGNKLYKSGCDDEDTMAPNATLRPSSYFDETVLRTNDQVLPLFQYPRSLTNNADLFLQIHELLQTWIMHVFPGSWPLTHNIRPTYGDLEHEFKVSRSHAKQTLVFLTENEQYADSPWRVIFQQLSEPGVSLGEETCDPVALKKQQEEQQMSMAHHQKKEPIGTCPFGRLKLAKRRDMHCAGFPTHPTLVLSYDVPSGFGQHLGYQGAQHTAYLPDNQSGRDLLNRLCYAFRQGLTFHIVAKQPSSASSGGGGSPEQVLGTGIPHKTSLVGGTHFNGWPDPNYFAYCNDYLGRLGVPSASDLPCSLVI